MLLTQLIKILDDKKMSEELNDQQKADDAFLKAIGLIQDGLEMLGALPAETKLLRTQLATLNQAQRDIDALIKKFST